MQRHCIRRQVFEVTVPTRGAAWGVQSELARLQSVKIEEIVDRCCSELSAPERVHRLGTIVVDLGALNAADLERELSEKLYPCLRQALSAHIREEEELSDLMGDDPAMSARLEIVSLFARAGVLPFFADASNPRLVDEAVGALLVEDAPRLLALVRDLARERGAHLRLIRHLRSERLLALFRELTREERAAELWELLSVCSGSAPSVAGSLVWLGALRVACGGASRSAGSLEFWREALTHVAIQAGVTYNTLVAGLAAALAGRSAEPRSAFGVVAATLHSENAPAAPKVVSRSNGTNARELAADPLDVDAGSPDAAPVSMKLVADSPKLEREAPELDQGAPELENHSPELDVDIPALDSGAAPSVEGAHGSRERALDLAASAPGLGTEALSPALNPRGPTPAPDSPKPSAKRPIEPRPTPMAAAPRPFDEPDEAYIENAGLVLLWPFLGAFFERLGLLVEKKFIDTPALHRAVGVLQHIATTELEPPEYRLPLPKIICGMALDDVFAMGPAITDAEAEECQNLVSAVLAHAPIFGDIAPEGLRRAYLCRRGVICARDGAWLLRVEKAPYDVVLEHLPWPMGWVRLPWMQAPLCVEWGS